MAARKTHTHAYIPKYAYETLCIRKSNDKWDQTANGAVHSSLFGFAGAVMEVRVARKAILFSIWDGMQDLRKDEVA